MFSRLINPSKNRSFFLFGARGTGKSTWIDSQWQTPKSYKIDLLDAEFEDRYSRRPSFLEADLLALPEKPDWVIIDEVQKVPRLLDQVHRLIENQRLKFALTGSSSRKLRRGGANLLAGRALLNSLHPLTSIELGEHFSLDDVLHWGSLPQIFSLKEMSDKKQYLRTYGFTYLKEEIRAEQVVRKVDPFRSFLEIGAQMSGKMINFKKIARDVGVDTKSIQNYFQILEDTWIGFYLPAFHQSVRKTQRLQPKFYFFDLGIKRALEGALDSKLVPGTYGYGESFEHWVIQEIHRLNDYWQKDFRLSYYQTYGGGEVDLVFSRGKVINFVEIKSTNSIDELEVRKLIRATTDFKAHRKFYLSLDNHPRQIGDVQCLHWKDFLQELKSW